MERLLKQIRVLDIGRYVAGPYCATLLGYFGAEVVRVERREGGEDRYIAPVITNSDGSAGEGGVFYQTGCGKKSVTLNLSTPKARAILVELARDVDIVVANLPPKALEKLGLDWPTFSAANPRGILVTQTSFGATGPDRDKGGFDGVAQAMSGAMYLSGTPGHPVKAGAPYVDFSTAIFSAMGTLAALMDRDRTGKGQHVETSLLGTALAAMNSHLTEQAATQIDRVGSGNRVQTSAPSDVFEVKDGHILVHTVGDGLFKRWTGLVGQPELAEDPRFQGDSARGAHRDRLCSIMAQWCAGKTRTEALAALEEFGVPAGPVLSLREAIDNPQAQTMGFFKSVTMADHQQAVPTLDLPIRFSELETGITNPPPSLGADTDAVLKRLGYDDAALQQFRADGII